MTQFNPKYKRIATEEAFATKEMIDLYGKVLNDKSYNDPGFTSLWGFYRTNNSPRAMALRERIVDLGEKRIADMDAAGIDHAILSLTSPGVQVFDAATANEVAKNANDILFEAIQKNPDRFSGLAAAAPQDPQTAAKEIERGVTKLGLKGVIINSHTQGEYLSDKKFWDIFAAAESLDVPIYLHPNTPPPAMIEPFVESGLDGAVFGFGVETSLHTLRIITSGVFDEFPKLKLVIGHMGESLPYWMFRLDYMHGVTVRANRYECMKPLKKQVSDYLKENVYVTNSGMAWAPAIRFSQQVLGDDRVLYAMDYPYQYEVDEVAVLDNEDISDESKKKFYQTNAERIFKLT